MGATQTAVADNGLKLTILAAEPADPTAIEDTELNAGDDVHDQLDSEESFPLEPSTKEYPAGSWSTGGQDPMIRSAALNYTVSPMAFKTMVDEPDTTRSVFTPNTPMWAAYRIGAANTQDDPWADTDVVYYVPLNIGIIRDDPVREGRARYFVDASYAGNGSIGEVVAGV